MPSQILSQTLSEIAAALNGLLTDEFSSEAEQLQIAQTILNAVRLAAQGRFAEASKLIADQDSTALPTAEQMLSISDDLVAQEARRLTEQTIQDIRRAYGRSERSVTVLRFSTLGARDNEDFSRFCILNDDGSRPLKTLHNQYKAGRSLLWTLSDFGVELHATQFPLNNFPKFRKMQLESLIELGYNLRVKFTDVAGFFWISL